MRAPEDRTREGARRLERKPADEALTAFGSEFTRPPSLIVVDCSAQAGVDPLASFADEPRAPQAAPQAERAREPRRMLRPRRRNVGPRRATQAVALVMLASSHAGASATCSSALAPSIPSKMYSVPFG